MFCWWLPPGLLNSQSFFLMWNSKILAGKNHWCNWCTPCFSKISDVLLLCGKTSDFSLVKLWNIEMSIKFPLCCGLLPDALEIEDQCWLLHHSCQRTAQRIYWGGLLATKPAVFETNCLECWMGTMFFEIDGRTYHSTTFYHVLPIPNIFFAGYLRLQHVSTNENLPGFQTFHAHPGPLNLRLCQLWPHPHALGLSARMGIATPLVTQSLTWNSHDTHVSLRHVSSVYGM